MSQIIAKSIEHMNEYDKYFNRCNFFNVFLASEDLFHSEIFVKHIQATPRSEKKLEFALEHNGKFLALCNTLDLVNIENQKLIANILRNVRKVFPKNSFHLKTLGIEKFTRRTLGTLIHINPSGLKEIILRQCLSNRDLRKILSINTLENFECYSVDHFSELKGVYPNIKALAISFSENLSFNFDMFPNIMELSLTAPDYCIDFVGTAENLLRFRVIPGEKIAIDFDQFPILENFVLETEWENFDLQMKNEPNQLRVLFFGFHKTVSMNVENCSFVSLQELNLDCQSPNDEFLEFFTESSISVLGVVGLKNIDILKKMKYLKELNINNPGYKKASEMKKFNIETINLYFHGEVTDKMKSLGTFYPPLCCHGNPFIRL